ncbi:PREDICTED: E3 ubiquitin-protein ligase TRIM71-like isoform X1 [Wasmannia auropunctata]|uniref:E3 ubiquitin-protein ligase TRIM71-like isoform X1 n=2 Tax=Wasmannia auropunctata TaxID=64793 RepID=UPI0005EFA16E|nr:PREDICTED: E3 ubiquitin-protein ligase TRIM71-like isoform X1 [Wasmannia auropunctata]
MRRFYPSASDTRGQLYCVSVQSSKALILERYASVDSIPESMLAARQYDCFAEGRSYERKARFFNRATQETSLELYQQFLPATMNPLKSPRTRIDINRHSMQLTNKPRKQDDQHFTPRKFTIAKKVRSFPDSSPDHFLKQFPPGGKLSQQHSKDNSFLNHVDTLNECSKLYRQSPMAASSLSCSSESRSSSSDDNLANHSPVHQLDTDSPDHFEYFRMFEDASVADVPGPSFSGGCSYRSDGCQAGYETYEDFNMNLLKIDLLDDISRRQSPVREGSSPIAQGDVLNDSLLTLMAKDLEKDESDVILPPSREQRTRSPSSQRDPTDVPLISSMSEELEVESEMKKEKYSGQQSPASEQWTRSLNLEDTSSVISIMNKDEVTKETEEDCPLDHRSLRILKPPYRCNDHPYTQLFYCQTCCKAICKECSSQCVYKHVTVDFTEYLEIAQRQAEEVLIEAYLGIDVLADDMENMGLDIAALDQRTREALTDVKFFSRRMWSAVEEREKKLFKQIVETRRWKYEVLHEKYMNLKEDKTRLSQAVSSLKSAIHNARSFPVCNPDNLLQRKDMVLAEIWQIRQNRKAKVRSVRDENWISFRSSDNNVLSVIANGGNVLVNGPGTIGDRLPNRDYKSLQSYFPYGINEQMMQPIPRGRPITDYDRNICLPNRKHELQVKSTDVVILGYFGENNPDNLCRPWGLICDNEGHIIISDRSNNRIQIYRENGTLVRKFGSYGNGPCQFNRPAGIAVDARRRLIVVDKDNHRVQILTLEGDFLRSFGEHGEKQGQFCYPWDVAVNSACEIAVTDTRNHRVQLFSPEGIPLRMFGGQPHLLRYLDSPRGICFNNEGKLIVTDFNNHHILIIEYNMVEMRILKCEKESKGKRQDGETGENGQNEENTPTFQRPQGVIAADDGSILVADSRHNSIKAFNSVGSLIYSYKPGQEEMDRPLGIALHWDGRMAFTDYGRNYVRLVKLEHHMEPMARNAIMFG